MITTCFCCKNKRNCNTFVKSKPQDSKGEWWCDTCYDDVYLRHLVEMGEQRKSIAARYQVVKEYVADCERPEVLDEIERLLTVIGVPLTFPVVYATGASRPSTRSQRDQQLEFLRADLAAIKQLLGGLGPEHFLERYSLERRQTEVQNELNKLEKTMYELTRQLELLESINWSVVRSRGEDKYGIKDMIPICKAHIAHPDVFTDTEKTAKAFVDFSKLAEFVFNVGELPFPQNKWLLAVGLKMLYWFGPEDEIRAMEAEE